MKKVVIFIGGCTYNKGSEAMVRGCVNMIRQGYNDCEIVLSSKDDITGKSINIPGVNRYIRRYMYDRNNKFIRYTIGIIRYILRLKGITNWLNHYLLFKECENADLVIIIGGDNYDKAYHAFNDMHSINKTLKRIIKGKFVFLNASLNPHELNKKIINDLMLFDLVTVREKITYNALNGKINENKLIYMPDIAFNLEAKKTKLPADLGKNKIVGINLSPLILSKKYTVKENIIMEAYEKIIEYVIYEMHYDVLLIPHVMNADIMILKKFYNKYRNTGKVYLIQDMTLNASEIKYIIAQCELFLGARTHSTIAAYGNSIPTLVLGYSVKSVGIARDIFGEKENYVITVQHVENSNEILQAFKDFVVHNEEIISYLHRAMPEYIKKSEKYSLLFQKVLNDDN